MVGTLVNQGDIWVLQPLEGGKGRPVLVVTRDVAIAVLNRVVVAPITSTVRAIPTCIPVGPAEGIDHESVASFDNLGVVPKAALTARLGDLGPPARRLICAALAALADC